MKGEIISKRTGANQFFPRIKKENYIMTTQYLTQKEVLQQQVVQIQQTLDTCNNNFSNEVLKMRVDLTKELALAASKIAKLEKSEARPSAEEAAQLLSEIQDNVEALIRENDFYFLRRGSGHWYTRKHHKWVPCSDHTLKTAFCELANPDYYAVFFEELKKQQRIVTELNYFWLKQAVVDDALNLLRWDFCPIANSSDHHFIFDALMQSLSNGKKENQDHIEQLILSKLLHPENILLPTLVLTGDGGGTGKSLLNGVLLKAIFGNHLVADNVTISQFMGDFNGSRIGKAVVFINEAAEDKSDADKLKAIFGSSTLIRNEKNEIACEVNATAWYIIACNQSSRTGAVKLADDNTDRRYSIVAPAKPLQDWLELYLPKLTATQRDQWVIDTGSKILGDKTAISKWLKSLYDKHGDVRHVRALHGEDYRNLLGKQESPAVSLARIIFEEGDFTHIKRKTMYKVYLEYSKQVNPSAKPLSRNNFIIEVTKLIQTYYPHIETKTLRLYHSASSSKVNSESFTTGDCWYNLRLHPLPKISNDHRYIDEDGKNITIKIDF
jgi:hypothetical protein